MKNCIICGEEVELAEDKHFVKRVLGVSLLNSEASRFKCIKPEETLCFSCKKESMFAAILHVSHVPRIKQQ